ncbi:MAG: DUF4012 domain-containing protein [Patescibacteria group bacterium]
MNSHYQKNTSKDDQEEYLKKTRVPRDNVLDLKHLFAPEEEVKRTSLRGKFNLSKFWPKLPAAKKIKLGGLVIGWKNVIVFGVVCLVLILPFLCAQGYQGINNLKGRVLGVSVSALDNLKSAGLALSNFDMATAADRFNQAENDFNAAQKELSQINDVIFALIKIIPFKGETVTSGQHLISAGKNIAEIGQLISEQLKPLTGELKLKEGELVVPKVLFSFRQSLEVVSDKMKAVKNDLDKVKIESLPQEYQVQILKIREALPALDEYLEKSKSMFSVLTSLLGQNKTQEFIFIFQNNREIRPTGGFMGSLALVTAKNGEVKILEVPGRGPYEINDDLSADIIPPKPLWLVNNKWGIQDANWFPDFPATAQKINWFYELSRGFSVDGIVSLTPDIIIDLLRITGPITLDKYETVITADNFIEKTQLKVEVEYDKATNQPKAIIGDLIPLLLNKVLKTKPGDFLELAKVLQKAVSEKNLLIYAKDENLEKELIDLDLGGEIKTAPKDYLMVVNTNIGGGKTDGVIRQEILHEVSFYSDGEIVDTLTIKRTHQGDPNNSVTKIKNMDYLRVYVPAGAELLSASGFSEIDKNLLKYPDEKAVEDKDLMNIEKDPVIDERSNTRITSEFGKTCFANWLNVEVGESKEVVLKYKLPFKLEEAGVYSLYLQKQPGVNDSSFTGTLTLPSDFSLIQGLPEGIIKDNEVNYQTTINEDKVYGVELDKLE